MIKKVSNWVFGSFFRTMGRFFFFLFFGFLLATILSKSEIKITDLLGIEMVKADTYYASYDETWYYNEDRTNALASGTTFMYDTRISQSHYNDNLVFVKYYASNQVNLDAVKGGHITIPYSVEFAVVQQNQTILNGGHCRQWTQQGSGYYCSDFVTDQGQEITAYKPNIVLNAYVEYTSGYVDNCQVNYNENYIYCPITNQSGLVLKDIIVAQKVYYIEGGNNYYRFGIGQKFNAWSNDTNSVIENQNQNTNQTISTITDTNTTEADTQATSFFDNFTSQDNGGISSIITAPLSAISGLVSATCTPITLPLPYLDNKTIVLPCMSAIYQEHFGAFFTIYQTIIFGALAYRMLVSIFMMIQGFKNPDDDKIEVVDL